MALRERFTADLSRVYMNYEHFASVHRWNGMPFSCVIDEETALKRKNNNVVDVSWDNNTTETMIYTPAEGFPGRALPNEHIVFDNRPMKILQVQNDEGMLSILLMAPEPKAVAV